LGLQVRNLRKPKSSHPSTPCRLPLRTVTPVVVTPPWIPSSCPSSSQLHSVLFGSLRSGDQPPPRNTVPISYLCATLAIAPSFLPAFSHGILPHTLSHTSLETVVVNSPAKFSLSLEFRVANYGTRKVAVNWALPALNPPCCKSRYQTVECATRLGG
jgi:hypothetical protein